MSEPPLIYLSKPDIRGNEVARVAEAIESGWLAPAGPALSLFEEELAAASGREFAVGLSSGTAGLQLALLALDIGPGDLVACSDLTFVATTNAIVHTGATPVLIDSDRRTWNMDPDLLESEIAARAGTDRQFKAVITVDLYGQCSDYERIAALCSEAGVNLIEDAAEALGSTCNGRPAGSFGEASIFSFNGNKIITSSGGGMLVTDREDIANRVRHLATQAREAAIHYEHNEPGFNFRLSNVLAALGSAQLASLDERVARKRQINAVYQERFGHLPHINFMPEADYGTCTYWLTCLTVDPGVGPTDASGIVSSLQEQRIESRPVWKPMHMQPAYSDTETIGGGVAERLFRDGICLPSGSGMTDEELDLVCERLAPLLGV